ncbi:MAG: hypothetical protein WDO19_28280 [Bacteroidota bacterium]
MPKKKTFYVAQVHVFVDGQLHSTQVVSGQGFNMNIVKGTAEQRVRAQQPAGTKVSSVFLSKQDMDLEEFKTATGGNPPWLGGDRMEA